MYARATWIIHPERPYAQILDKSTIFISTDVNMYITYIMELKSVTNRNLPE